VDLLVEVSSCRDGQTYVADTYYAGQSKTFKAVATTAHCGKVGYRSGMMDAASREKDGHNGLE
jgi:hypothetical protein